MGQSKLIYFSTITSYATNRVPISANNQPRTSNTDLNPLQIADVKNPSNVTPDTKVPANKNHMPAVASQLNPLSALLLNFANSAKATANKKANPRPANDDTPSISAIFCYTLILDCKSETINVIVC